MNNYYLSLLGLDVVLGYTGKYIGDLENMLLKTHSNTQSLFLSSSTRQVPYSSSSSIKGERGYMGCEFNRRIAEEF